MVALIYQLFAVLCGWLEAILYAKRAAETFTSNEHVGMTWQRISAAMLVPTTMLCVAVFGGLWWPLAVELVVAALLFPLFHDEAYNFTRLWIDFRTAIVGEDATADKAAWRQAWDKYTYGYQSATTTARHDLNGKTRTILAALGILVLVAMYGWYIFIY